MEDRLIKPKFPTRTLSPVTSPPTIADAAQNNGNSSPPLSYLFADVHPWIVDYSTTNFRDDQYDNTNPPPSCQDVDDIGPLDLDLFSQLKELHIDTLSGFATGTYWSGKVEVVDLKKDEPNGLVKYDHPYCSASLSTFGNAINSAFPATRCSLDVDNDNSGKGKLVLDLEELESIIHILPFLIPFRNIDITNYCGVAESGSPCCLYRAWRSARSLVQCPICDSCQSFVLFLRGLLLDLGSAEAQNVDDAAAEPPEATNHHSSVTATNHYSSVTQEKRRREVKCGFCANGSQTVDVCTSHVLRVDGVITCPVLRSIVCKVCGATGDDAHTIANCPIAFPTEKAIHQHRKDQLYKKQNDSNRIYHFPRTYSFETELDAAYSGNEDERIGEYNSSKQSSTRKQWSTSKGSS